MPTDRRTFLKTTLKGTAALGLTTSLLGGCRNQATSGPPLTERPGYQPRRATQTGPVQSVRLTAAETEVEVGPGQVYRTWCYNGQFPGPEIRVRQGERLQVTIDNQLPEATTIHWHGVPVPNAMDGVPGVTQEPIAPGDTFQYDFVADPSGTYLYHSHVGLQIDRGLVAALIIEENNPPMAYDREYVLVLDDFLPQPPNPHDSNDRAEQESGGMMGGRGMMGRRSQDGGGMNGMMGGEVPPYAGLLINGKLPADPVAIDTKQGDRVRLRLVNPSGATTFRVAIGGHQMTVTHTDGQAVEPVTVDALRIGMGERYDVIIESNNPGAWPIMAATIEGTSPPARAILRYTDAARATPPDEAVPEGLRRGRLLGYGDLKSLDLPETVRPDRTFDLTLSGGMMGGGSGAWTIDGEIYPEASPLEIREGERVRFNMVNRSMMLHPMHLHGHFFRVGDVFKDTVLVDPHMGRLSFDFLADHPGDWFFHCHHAYHLESGMARVVTYVGGASS